MMPSESEKRDTIIKMKGDFFVVAGAGAGKTSLISKRIAYQLKQGISPRVFVIITFTNAAANELRDRIATEIRELLDDTYEEKERDNLINAENEIELMNISTIHSFLLKILREYSFESQFLYDGLKKDSDQDLSKKKEFFHHWFNENYQEVKCLYDDWEIQNINNGSYHNYLYEALWTGFKDIADIRERIVFDTTDRTKELEDKAKSYLINWWPKLREYKKAIDSYRPNKLDGSSVKLRKDAEQIITQIEHVEKRPQMKVLEAACIISEIIDLIRKTINYYYQSDDTEDATKKLINKQSELDFESHNSFKKEFEIYQNSYNTSKLMEKVCLIQKEYQSQNDINVREISDNDILFRANCLLTEHPEVCEKIRRRFTQIYIDEFQDTNDLQTNIIKKLKGGSLKESQETSLFLVGDSKQSIYRFTGADVSVFKKMRESMMKQKNTNVIELFDNYRSNQDILNWVNQYFASPYMKNYVDMQTDWIVQDKDSLHGVYQYGVNGDYKKSQDVENVIHLVKDLVNKEEFFLEEYKRSKQSSNYVLRKIKYSDFLIITKYTTSMSDYVKAFEKEGIPINVLGKVDVSLSKVLTNLLDVLRYFAFPKDKRKRLKCLQIMKGYDITKVSSDRLKNDSEELNTLRKSFKENKLNTPAIVQYIVEHRDYYFEKNKDYEKEELRAIRIEMHQCIETCLSKNTGDLINFVAIMEEYIKKDVEREISLESNENAIRIMNVHKSKGLTGNIVIIADRSNVEKIQYDSFRKDNNYYPTITIDKGFGKRLQFCTYGYNNDLKKYIENEEKEESIRLQYVAATRAAQALIFMPEIKEKTWFSEHPNYKLQNFPDILEWIKLRENDKSIRKLEIDEKVSDSDRITLDDLETYIYLYPEDFTKHQRDILTPSKLEKQYSVGYTTKDKEYQKENRPSGDVFGTTMHRVFEMMANGCKVLSGLKQDALEKQINIMINQAIIEEKDDLRANDHPEEYIHFLQPIMVIYFKKLLQPIFENASKIYPEFTFSFYIKGDELKEFTRKVKIAEIENDVAEIWVNGKADLVVINHENEIVIYDYKSDERNGMGINEFSKRLEDKYSSQLALYKYAIERIFSSKNIKTKLINLYMI